MPYIVEEKRHVLDPSIEQLVDTLRGLQCDDPDGDNLEGNLNYVISTILGRLYHGGYADINAAVGLLSCIQLEYYRRQAAPYEDQKAHENGDVFNKTTLDNIGQ